LPQNGFFLELSGKEQHQLQIISIVFLTDGILLKSGKALKADIIITTGLDLLAFGGVKIQLDSQPFDISKSFVYKGLMLSDLPNFFIFCWLYQCIMDVKKISLVNIFRDF
jgi:hypothetical protein